MGGVMTNIFAENSPVLAWAMISLTFFLSVAVRPSGYRDDLIANLIGHARHILLDVCHVRGIV